MSDFMDMVEQVTRAARKEAQVSTLAHLLVEALSRSPRAVEPVFAAATTAVREQILCRPPVQKSDVQPDRFDISYDPDAAERDFRVFVSGKRHKGRLVDDILAWLLDGNFSEKTLERCREICRSSGLTQVLATPDASVAVPGSVGVLVTDDWLRGETERELEPTERSRDLAEHLGFLAQAILDRRHYLLTGPAGVGKSLFVRHLVRAALSHWRSAADPSLRHAQFLFLGDTEFCGSEKDVQNRLGLLYEHLAGHPNMVPVFDGFEILLEETLPLRKYLTEFFGAMLGGRSRTLVLVCRSGPAGITPLLRGTRGWPLPPLSASASCPLFEDGLASAIKRAQIEMGVERGRQEYCREVAALATDRYPGHAFPGIGLRLIEAVVQRSVSRRLRDPASPAEVTLADLKRHVATEQGLSVEVIEKEPDTFYKNLAETLKTGEVIGQDHVVDRVCRVLLLKAKGKPRKLPRGRFLLVGPPGVGKTQLGRSLAKCLGYGTAGFFSYNMADFAGEGDRWRFVGAPAGYEGFNQVRTIFDEVRERPSCVVLLDEIDRAHAAIQDVLLAMLEGEAKDYRNERVYFSQAIFLLTTNQGQDQVSKAYESGKQVGMPRTRIAERFNAILRDGAEEATRAERDADEDMLRRLILQGVVDSAELSMSRHLDEQLNELRADLPARLQADWLTASKAYLGLREMRDHVRQVLRKTALDRAFLDRIDFVLPFFPIKEEGLLNDILNIKLVQAGWEGCPQEIRQRILGEALAEQESVRPLERLIERYLSDASGP